MTLLPESSLSPVCLITASDSPVRMDSLTSSCPSCRMQSVQMALPAVSTSRSPLRISSGRMFRSVPSCRMVTVGCASRVSRSICRLALISCMMPTTVLMRMIAIKRIFFHAPTVARETAISRFSRLNTVQILSRRICGIVFVALFMKTPPDLFFSFSYTLHQWKGWRKR